jgi:hypothetical protein
MAGCCENGNELPGSIKIGEFGVERPLDSEETICFPLELKRERRESGWVA